MYYIAKQYIFFHKTIHRESKKPSIISTKQVVGYQGAEEIKMS